jgi:hypothetical protein
MGALGDARALLTRPSLRNNPSDDTLDVLEEDMLGRAEDMPSEATKFSIHGGIVASPVQVIRAIDFNDEADLGASEVDDMVSNDELAPERKASLGAGELAPEPFFRASW